MPFTESQLTKRLGKPSERVRNAQGRKGAHGDSGNLVPTKLPDTLNWKCGCVAKPSFSGSYDLAACPKH